jgi:hypothetical protein
MTVDFAERDVAERLHLPPVPVEDVPTVVRLRPGGLVVAVAGLLVAVVAALAWSRHPDGWTWVCPVALWLGAHLAIAGFTYGLRQRRPVRRS